MNAIIQSENVIDEAKKRGVISRSSLYSVVSAHSHEAIDTLITLLNSTNDNVRLGAARAILDKCLPDIKAIEVVSDDTRMENLVIVTNGTM